MPKYKVYWRATIACIVIITASVNALIGVFNRLEKTLGGIHTILERRMK